MLQNLLRRWDFAHRGICDERRRQQLGISLNAGVDVRERGKGKGKSGLVPSCPATVPSPASTHEIALAPKLWKPNALTERATGCSRGGHFGDSWWVGLFSSIITLLPICSQAI